MKRSLGAEVGVAKLKVALAAGGAAGALATANRVLAKTGEPARLADGDEQRYLWRGWKLSYKVAGEPGAPPLLLVHGVYAGASSYEFRKNFSGFAKDFRVYALDLLGCGLSERPRRPYKPEDVAAQVEDFAREEIGTPTNLAASSLSAALVMLTAVWSPRLFKRLILICPTGLLGEAVYNLFRTPVLGGALYNAIVSRRAIRYYLGNVAYYDPKFATDELVEDHYRTSHQPGAKHFPAAFVSGKLSFSVEDYWSRVPRRTLIAWGRAARSTRASQGQQFVRMNPRAELKIFRDSALLPHDERAQTFNEVTKTFLLREKEVAS